MDEKEYKLVRDNLTIAPCAFEKSVLALKTQCSQAIKKNIAEREVVMCTSMQYADRCSNWLIKLRIKSRFSLHITGQEPVLPHAKEMKLQVGGMLGLCKILEIGPGELNFQPNVFEVLEVCGERVSNLEDQSFVKIAREIVHFRLR